MIFHVIYMTIQNHHTLICQYFEQYIIHITKIRSLKRRYLLPKQVAGVFFFALFEAPNNNHLRSPLKSAALQESCHKHLFSVSPQKFELSEL